MSKKITDEQAVISYLERNGYVRDGFERLGGVNYSVFKTDSDKNRNVYISPTGKIRKGSTLDNSVAMGATQAMSMKRHGRYTMDYIAEPKNATV